MADKVSKFIFPVKSGNTIANKEYELPGGSSFDGDYNSLTNKPTLGTASAKDVPSSGNASSSQVVMGNDSRLSDSRNAKDVSAWAKAASKPTYTASEVGAIATTAKGAANGVAELDSSGKVPSSQLPSYVDDTIEGYLYNSKWYKESAHTTEITGETGKIYVDLSTNKTYRWSGSAFVEISASLALGETSSTAYRGDRGKAAYDHSQSSHARTDATKTEASSTNGNIKINGTETTVYTHPGSGTNPHGTTKSDVGLGNVPNVTTDNQTPSFTEASTRANIATGEKLSVIFGKIKKYFTDLKAVAFSGSYNDLSDKPTIPTNTDSKVSQTATTTSADYEVLFSSTADNTTRTEGARKNSNLKFNPSTGNLQTTKLNGVDVGSSPKFTDSDTKNTAGATDTSSKLFLIGAKSQGDNPQTYSQDTAWVGANGCLYSGGQIVLTSHQDISGKANLASPAFTGTPKAPTAEAGTNTTQIATTAFVQAAIDNTQQMIAPIQSNLTASKTYAVGEQFIYEGKLYTATSAIAEGATIVIGTNASLSAEIVKQIKSAKDAIGNLADLDTTDKSSSVAAINEVNTKVSKTEALISNSNDAYSSSKAYAVGDYVIRDDKLYRCTTACSAGSWATNQSCFVRDTLTSAVNTAFKKPINQTYIGSLNYLPTGWVYAGTTSTDKPDSSACFVLTMRHVNEFACQLAISRTGETYVRLFNGTDWTSWSQL